MNAAWAPRAVPLVWGILSFIVAICVLIFLPSGNTVVFWSGNFIFGIAALFGIWNFKMAFFASRLEIQGILDDAEKRKAGKTVAAELGEFLSRLKKVDDDISLGRVATQVALVARDYYSKGIVLHEPQKAVSEYPDIVWTLEEDVIQLQKQGRQAEAPGPIVWVNTLRAIKFPEIRSAVVEMWQCVARGFPYALGDLLALNVPMSFLQVPDGFEK